MCRVVGIHISYSVLLQPYLSIEYCTHTTADKQCSKGKQSHGNAAHVIFQFYSSTYWTKCLL